MVFEKLAVHLLDKYLSGYIENLDYKKLKIDIWSGNVVLENLYLKSNALDDLNLPVTVTLGYLQKLTLQVPWKNLYTHPTKVFIDGLYVLVIPKIEVEYNAKEEEKQQHEAKMKEVEKIEKLHNDKENPENPNNETKKDNDTFGARMKLQIIQNLELSIRNIHIVYEDKTTKPNHPFAFGITLNYITFQTTNNQWVPTVMKENNPIIYKLGELNALSIYLNTDIKSQSNLPRNEIIKNLQTKIAVNNTQVLKDMTYIFRPFNVKAKLIMTLKPRQQKFEKPMFHITIDLERISLNLNRTQYLDILDLLEFQDHLTAKVKYVKYRPKVFDGPKQKWKFAYNAIVQEKIRPRLKCYQWEHIKLHLKRCREYRLIYSQELKGKITNEQKQRAEELEKALDVFILTYIRRRVQIEARIMKQQEPKSILSNISNWWNKKTNQTDPELNLEKVMSDEEKKKFYETIGYEGEDTSTLTYPKEYVDIDLTIRLNMLDLNIWSKINDNDPYFRVIARAALPNTELIFRRRPATSSALFLMSLGSFQVFGISTDSNLSELLNTSRPVLIQPTLTTQQKLFRLEFEINPLNKDSGYRIQVSSESLEIKYNAPTINKLTECFKKDTQHNLQGVKQIAYTTYTDVKQQSIILMKYNMEKVKVLDVYIDLKSSYFVLPENGVYYDGCAAICLDMGHLVFHQGNNQNMIENYIPFQLELKKFQLLYANQNEDWKNACQQENTRLHLIKPITLYMNVYKCIYPDDINFPGWKISGQIPAINMRLSDIRLFKIMKHLQSLSFPESDDQDEPWFISSTQIDTLKVIETMTPIKKILQKGSDEDQKIKQQLTQIEANFELTQIDLLLEEEKDNKEQAFLHILLRSIYAQAFVKTFEIELQASLDDLTIYHEQFITNGDQRLQLLAAQIEEKKKLVYISIIHKLEDHPSKSDELENKVRIHLNRFLLTLQLEALLSIMRFQDNIMQKWPSDQTKKTNENTKTVSNIGEFVKKNASSTLEIKADLEEFRVVIATINTQLFDLYVQGVKADMHHTFDKTLVNLILTDCCISDPNINARYRKIISQQSGDNELLSISMVLYNYPKRHIKSLNDVDCDIKINFAKANIILLYKHIDQIMIFIDTLNISKSAIDLASTQADAVYEQLQKQAFKLRLDATFNAPNIIIPVNSSSDDALHLDLGKLFLQTKFIDDKEKLLIEKQEISIENILASRIKLNKMNEIQSEIILLKCAELKTNIGRLLYPEKVKTKPFILIKMQWDLIHFRLAKDDFACLMKVFTENFRDQTIITNDIREQYGYRLEQQKFEEDDLRKAAIKQQTDWQIGEILEKIKFRAEIKKLALTLYLDETNLINRLVEHNKNSKFANIEIETFELDFRHFSDSSYKATACIKNFLFDDLRETHKQDAVIHMIYRHFTVDPNVSMLNASLEFTPKERKRSLNAQLESLYICIKLDYLMILKEFFITDDVNRSQTVKISERNQLTNSIDDENIDTNIEVIIKNPEIILLEDQHKSNSNCLVLHFALKMRIINIGNETKIFGELNNLAIYSSNFAELKESKIKYRILQPAKMNVAVIMDSKQQKIDVQISDIIVNIAPAAVGILIGVMNSLGKDQKIIKQEEFDIQTMFNPKAINKGNFWFLQKEVNNTPTSTDQNISTNLLQQFLLKLKTIEIKLDVGTQSVAAICLSNWSVELKNWSNKMSVSSTMDIEAALYNEHLLSWEPLIEPTLDDNGKYSPWNITGSITPIFPIVDRPDILRKIFSALNPQQLISIRTEQLLNITITKTGVEVIKLLSTIFNDIYNQRLPKYIDDDEPMLSLLNSTGQSIFINNLNGLKFSDDNTWSSKVLERDESVALTATSKRSYRLSVIEEQAIKTRQEFTIQINNKTKLISINRTWQRIYNLAPSLNPSYSIQLLCETEIHHNRRRVVLSSVVKIYNNTTFPIVIYDLERVTGQSTYQIGVDECFHVPFALLYKTYDPALFIGNAETTNNFFIFNWVSQASVEEKFQAKNGQTKHIVVYKEIKKVYTENTDEIDLNSHLIYVHCPLHLTNLLPIDIQCSINNVEEIYLKPNEVRSITSGNKSSMLRFTIGKYDRLKWISDPVDLKKKNEHIVVFRNEQKILRMILHMDVYHQSYRLSLYAPYWIINHTDLQLEFRIGNEKMFIKNTDQAFLICPEKYKSDSNEKGQIRLHGITENWSEKFSLDVIKSTGMAGSKGSNDKTYMICVDITTSSFGLTKLVTLSPAMVIINKTSIPIEIVETVLGKEQGNWSFIETNELISFWPVNAKDSLMRVRYAHNKKQSKSFLMNKKHQTLLYMNDDEHLVIFVEVFATDFDGVRIIFSDYKQGDAPVLLVNQTQDQVVSIAQKDDTNTRYLVPESFVYYTWMHPLKPRELIVSCNNKPITIKLSPHRGVVDKKENCSALNYVVFIDGVQTVLLFSDNERIIETALNIRSSTQLMCRRLQISIPDVGVSIVNDILREELLYISLNKSKVIWGQMKKSRLKPYSRDIHKYLEELYKTNIQLIEENPDDETIHHTKYQMNEYKEVTFYENTAELINQKGERKLAKRQSLEGLWIEYTWSMRNAALYVRINRVQIDNQLDCTSFPSLLYPVLSKTSESDVEKPFIELSIYETKTVQSNIMHIQYCRLLIQEFAFRIDQGFILAILAFLREEKNVMTPIINMDGDLKYIQKSLQDIIKAQTDSSTDGTQMYFDNIHLSPLKIHVSFSMHGSKRNEELFEEYPLVGFLLRTLNVAEVEDVVLRLGFYERSADRFTIVKLKNEVLAHYQNQFLKQIHVLIFGLDVLGNPLGIIRGLAEGVESLFYEPYKGAIEGPIEFAEGVATGVLTLVGSTVGTAAGVGSRLIGVVGKGLATLTFDEEHKNSRVLRREPAASAVTNIASGGKNVVMGFVDGVTGVVTKPVTGAIEDGASGFFKGLGKGLVGLVARPTGGIVDFATTSLDVVKRTATQEQIVRRIRYPRHVDRDGLVRPYIPHEAMGSFILNRLEKGKYTKTDTYIAHITCSDSPPSWLMATSKRILFITEISFLGMYDIDWRMDYMDLQKIPVIVADRQGIEILLKKPPNASAATRQSGKIVKYRNINEARYFVNKVTNAMHSMGL